MRIVEGPAKASLLNALFFFTENVDFLASQALLLKLVACGIL